MLEKRPIYQVYKVSKAFPEKWIHSYNNEGYRIDNVDFKQGEWFVVMNKKVNFYKQEYKFDPSAEQIKDFMADGFSIEEIVIYNSGNRFHCLFIFNKLSINSVKTLWAALKTSTKANINKYVQKTYDKGEYVKVIRSLRIGLSSYFSILGTPNGDYNQIQRNRVDFPVNLIENKKEQGFRLTSIAWDHSIGKWNIIMTKNKPIRRTNNTGNIVWYEDRPWPKWTWINYRTEKKKMEKLISEGYSIYGLN